jgi:acyl-CoA thioester hydrolase
VPSLLSHRVRYHEVDAQGFLFNSRYLELADVGMTELFRQLGYSYSDLLAAGADPSVVSARLTYHAPAFLDDIVEVATRCTRVGGSSFDLVFNVRRTDDSIAEMTLVYVNVDAAAVVSRPLPAAIAEALWSDLGDPTSSSAARRCPPNG